MAVEQYRVCQSLADALGYFSTGERVERCRVYTTLDELLCRFSDSQKVTNQKEADQLFGELKAKYPCLECNICFGRFERFACGRVNARFGGLCWHHQSSRDADVFLGPDEVSALAKMFGEVVANVRQHLRLQCSGGNGNGVVQQRGFHKRGKPQSKKSHYTNAPPMMRRR